MSQDNAEIVRQLVQAFNEGGMGAEATLSFFAADAVFEEPPEQPGPRVAHGRESVGRMFTQFDEAWEKHQSHADEVRAIDDERILLLSLEHLRARDRIELDQSAWTIFTLRGGKIVRMQSFWDRVNALEAAGLSE